MMRIEHTDNATLPIPEAVCESSAWEALRQAARSLRTISEQAGKDEYMKDMLDIRCYAASRATVAEAALAQQQRQAAAVEVDLLPLPEGESSSFGNYEVHDNETMIEYARANVAHATAPLQAEIEALRAEVERLRADRGSLEQKMAHPAITHCDNCGCDWLDNGLNPVGCPYCKQSAWR
jgi:DNA repair exonuclease SbcCD ATPase subunit